MPPKKGLKSCRNSRMRRENEEKDNFQRIPKKADTETTFKEYLKKLTLISIVTSNMGVK